MMPEVMDYSPAEGRSGLYFRHETFDMFLGGLHSEEAVHPVVDPDDWFEGVEQGYLEQLAELLPHRLPTLAGARLGDGWAGLYPVSPDGRPQVGPCPENTSVIAACGVGGYGIQVSPIVGRLAAEWIAFGEARSLPEAGELLPGRPSLSSQGNTPAPTERGGLDEPGNGEEAMSTETYAAAASSTAGAYASEKQQAEIIEHFGYEQQLDREMGWFSSFAASFSGVSITTGVLLTLPFVLTQSGTAGLWTWIISAFGCLLIATIFADLAGRIPLAGYAYQWASRLTNPNFGWFVAVCGLIGFGVGAAGTAYGVTPYFLSEFGIETTRNATIIGAAALTLLVMLINIAGIRIATTFNNAAVVTEISRRRGRGDRAAGVRDRRAPSPGVVSLPPAAGSARRVHRRVPARLPARRVHVRRLGAARGPRRGDP